MDSGPERKTTFAEIDEVQHLDKETQDPPRATSFSASHDGKVIVVVAMSGI